MLRMQILQALYAIFSNTVKMSFRVHDIHNVANCTLCHRMRNWHANNKLDLIRMSHVLNHVSWVVLNRTNNLLIKVARFNVQSGRKNGIRQVYTQRLSQPLFILSGISYILMTAERLMGRLSEKYWDGTHLCLFFRLDKKMKGK